MRRPTLIVPIIYIWFFLFICPPDTLNAALNVKYETRNAEECRRMVNHNYDAIIEKMRNSGSSSRSISSVEERGRNLDLRVCQGMAQKERFIVMEKAYERLSDVLELYRQQSVLTEQHHQVLLEDYVRMKSLPKSEYLNAYFRLYTDYQRYKSTVPKQTQLTVDKHDVHRCVDELGKTTFSDRPCLSELSAQRNGLSSLVNDAKNVNSEFCRELVEKAGKSKLLYEKAISTLIAIDPQAPDPEIDWRTVDKLRSGALSDYKYHLTRAGWVGCPITAKEQLKSRSKQQMKSRSPLAAPHPFIDLSFAAGRLLYAGETGIKLSGGTISLLQDGSILQYGGGLLQRADEPRSEYLGKLRADRRSIVHLKESLGLWDSELRGWAKLAYPDECPLGARLFHTATVLKDKKILFAGGICDAKLSQRTNRYPDYNALSVWDPVTRKWLSASSLSQGRLYHTASLLNDGSVLFVGGEADPGVVLTPGEPVTNSVERYVDGRVETMPPLNIRRAKHRATVTENGCVLISGGFDKSSQPISEVEQWCPSEKKWRLLPQLHTARYDHTATLLEDGRVIVVGGKGEDEQSLNSTEIWVPALGSWVIGPSLPLALHRHDAIRLSDGRILIAGGTWESATPWAWVWDTQADYWLLAGNVTPQMAWNKHNHIKLFALDNSEALVITKNAIMRWEPLKNGQNITTPVWKSNPSAIELTDGRVMMVGKEYGDPENGRQNARIWNPVSDRWQYAGSPGRSFLYDANLIELGSREVLYLARDTHQRYYCEIWQPNSTNWQSCGRLDFEYKSSWPPELGFISDGRVIALINKHEAYVFDRRMENWQRFQVKWHMEGLFKGAPVRIPAPLAVVIDPDTGKQFEINDLGSRMLWPRTTSAYTMLWNEDREEWSYILSPGEMGIDTHFLPDGCAISSSPLAIFNPESGKVTRQPDPGIGIKSVIKMVVMKNGGVVFVGDPSGANDPGNGFFHAKASCEGITSFSGNADYFSSRWLSSKSQPVRSRQGLTTLDAVEDRVNQKMEKPGANQKENRYGQIGHIFMLVNNNKVWLIVIAAILLGMAFLHFLQIPYIPYIPKWVLRIPVYAILTIYLVPPIWFYLTGETRPETSLFSPYRSDVQKCRDDPRACIDPETGLLINRKGESRIPCHLVGDWTLRQNKSMYRIRFKDDGTYVMTNSFSGRGSRDGYHGYWAVQDTYLVWRHVGWQSDLDINKIIPESDQRFKVVEMDGAETVYELIKLEKSAMCTQSSW